MKKVISIVFIHMLITFLFAGCAGEVQNSRAVTEPTAPSTYTETEKLYHRDHTTVRRQTEYVYDAGGLLTEMHTSQYDVQSTLVSSTVTAYGPDGAVTAYEERHYSEDGALAMSLVKQYHAGGIPQQQVEVLYWENGNPRSVRRSNFSDTGMELESLCRDYFEDGTLAAKERNSLDEETGFRIVSGESYHDNGTRAYLCEGIYHAVTGQLLDGKVEKYDENGNLTQLEEALWDGETRTGKNHFVQYDVGGAQLHSQQITQCYDSFGNVTVYEYTAYEQNHTFASHRIENRTFDEAGNLITNEIRYYLEDGTPSEQYAYSYEYDDEGNLIFKQNIHDIAPGVRQNHTATEYAYDEADHLIRETQTGFDASGVQKFQLIKEYDAYGNIVTFVTVSDKGNRYTYSYTYDEEGRQETELLTTEYKYGIRIDYQKTTYEYHENGNYKTVSLQEWTSYDEARAAPDADISTLGKTTVTEYDEEGNKI